MLRNLRGFVVIRFGYVHAAARVGNELKLTSRYVYFPAWPGFDQLTRALLEGIAWLVECQFGVPEDPHGEPGDPDRVTLISDCSDVYSLYTNVRTDLYTDYVVHRVAAVPIRLQIGRTSHPDYEKILAAAYAHMGALIKAEDKARALNETIDRKAWLLSWSSRRAEIIRASTALAARLKHRRKRKRRQPRNLPLKPDT